MSREELLKKTVKDLHELCKERNLQRYEGKKQLTKDVLIESIIRYESQTEAEETVDTEVEAGVSEQEKETVKLEYVQKAEVGTLVAFRSESGKVKSAMITKKSTPRQILQVQTSYGAVFTVDYKDVIWVKSGKRWPKGVYEMLRGKEDESRKCI